MKSVVHSLWKNRSGMAATEFALLLPVLLFIFFGVVEGSDALTVSRKVSQASNTLADLTAQETEIQTSAADDLFTGVEQIINIDGAVMDIRLISVIANPDDDDGDGNPDGNPIVHWSYDNSGGTPIAAGQPYTGLANPALLDANASIIVAEISYPYTSPFSRYFVSTINFEESATRWPRRSFRVQLCTSPGNCTS